MDAVPTAVDIKRVVPDDAQERILQLGDTELEGFDGTSVDGVVIGLTRDGRVTIFLPQLAIEGETHSHHTKSGTPQVDQQSYSHISGK